MRKNLFQKIQKSLSPFIIALLIAMIVRSFIFENTTVPTCSMMPNIMVNDIVFVNKLSYGYGNQSLSLDPKLRIRLFEKDPEIGDVIVFKPKIEDGKTYIKRLIAKEGDEVQFINGVIHINDKPVLRKKIASKVNMHFGSYGKAEFCDFDIYEETLPNNKKYYILQDHRDSIYEENYFLSNFPNTTEIYRIPTGYYFCIGDNRDKSSDSRFLNKIGYVPKDNVLGKGDYVVWNFRIIWDLLKKGDFSSIKNVFHAL